jgi:hypothetical protein
MEQCPECAMLTKVYQRAWVAYDSAAFRIQKIRPAVDDEPLDAAWNALQQTRRAALAAKRALDEHVKACALRENPPGIRAVTDG